MEIDHLIKMERARRETYRLIADFYLLPEPGYLNKVAFLDELLRIVCPEVTVHLPLMQQDWDLQQLKIDHARLFVGPFRLLAPPYGSVYLENKRELMGDSTLDVRKRYQTMGLKLSKDHLEAPDHIATELEFMHFLIYKELESLATGGFADALALVKEQKDFLEKHLGVWIPAFTVLVEEHATTGFFRSLASITRAFVQVDRQYVVETNLPYLVEVSTET